MAPWTSLSELMAIVAPVPYTGKDRFIYQVRVRGATRYHLQPGRGHRHAGEGLYRKTDNEGGAS